MFKKNFSNKDKPEDDMSDFEFDSPDTGESDFEDNIRNLITKHISEGFDEGVVVSKWIVVAEVIDSDSSNLVSLSSSSCTPWDFLGMLKAESSVVELGYSTAVNVAHYPHDDDDED